MSSLSAAISSLQSSQRALEVISNNIANANTPGYHRQLTQLSSRSPERFGGIAYGRGVDVVNVRQVRSDVLERAFTNQKSTSARYEAQLRLQTRLESRISVDAGSPLARIEDFFNDLEQLSTRLDDTGLRNVIVNEAQALTEEFNALSGELRQFQSDIDTEIGVTVEQVNSLSSQIAGLNVEISRSEVVGTPANDLRDQRDELINQLGELVNVSVSEGNAGQSTVISNGVVLVIGANGAGFGTSLLPNAKAAVTVKGTNTEVNIANGKLAGLLNTRNESVDTVREQLDEIARELISSFNTVHAQGVGTRGGFTRIESKNPVDDITVPLRSAGLAFTPTSGNLSIGVTNSSTGERIVYDLPPVDPGTLTLQGLANSIAATVTQVSTFAAADSGKLVIQAANGFTFDFAGGFDTTPTAVGATTSTASLTLGGAYTSTANDDYTFTFSGSGTVGVTAGLQLNVTNSAGTNLGTFNIGSGYAAGDAINVANGITVKVGAGTTVAGDDYVADVVGNSDTTGLLNALGLNSFFTGSDSASIGVNPDVAADQSRIATSRTGKSGDSTNLQRLIDVRRSKLFESGTADIREFSTSLIAEIGTQLEETIIQQETSDTLFDRISAERESLSGVDPNEELVHMIKFQRQFEIAAKFISTVNQTLDELLRVI